MLSNRAMSAHASAAKPAPVPAPERCIPKVLEIPSLMNDANWRVLRGNIAAVASETGRSAAILHFLPQAPGALAIDHYFADPAYGDELARLLAAIEQSRVTFYAAITGTVTGPALGLALACGYRVIGPRAVFSCPEAGCGTLPPGAVLWRLTQIAGGVRTADMVAFGKNVAGQEALAARLATHLTDDPLALSFSLTASQAAKQRLPPGFADRTAAHILPAMQQKIMRHFPGQELPRAALRALEQCIIMAPMAAAERIDAARQHLALSPQGRALRHAHRTEQRGLHRVAGHRDGGIRRVAIIGMGDAGMGLAGAMVAAGLHVAVAAGSEHATRQAIAALIRGSGRPCISDRPGRIVAGDDNALRSADLVIEAVGETADEKRAVISRAVVVCRENISIASTSANLPLAELGAGLPGTKNLFALRTAGPFATSRYIEIEPGTDATPAARQAALKLFSTLFGHARLAPEPGGPALLTGYAALLREACFLMDEGATPAQIDQSLFDDGFTIAPLLQADRVGLDTGLHPWAYGRDDPMLRYSPLWDLMCDAGRLGIRSGKGWYRHLPGRPAAGDDPQCAAILEESSLAQGIIRRPLTAAEIIGRCRQSITRGLQQNDSLEAWELDLAWLAGGGFPRWRGGPGYRDGAVANT
jgi:3-hydroxyacyl-CoA dehydrogenase